MLNPREAPWRVIVVFLVASSALVALINLVLFPGPWFDPIARATGGLIDATLQANLLNILLFVLIVFGWGRLRPIAVGLDWGKLGQGLALTAALWAAAQAIVLLINAINGEVRPDPAWAARGATVVIGGLIAQLLGNALFEEMAYRGFYLGQLYRKLEGQEERRRLAAAVLATLALFIVSHIPNRVFAGYSLADIPGDFAFLFVLGLFFTIVYLVSGNLFLAVGVHALMNRPTMITEATLPAGMLVGVLALVLVVMIWVRRRRQAGAAAEAST